MQGSRAMTKKEIERVEHCLQDKYFKNTERNLMLFRFCLYSGCRINEPLSLKVSDVLNAVTNDVQNSVQIRKTKNGKNHHVSLGKILREYIKDYIKGMSPSQYLFPSQLNRNASVSTNSANKAINNAMKRTGINGITSHSCRKTFALTLRRNGGDLEQIRGAMNVSSVQVLSNHYFTANQFEIGKLVDNLHF